MLSTTSQINNVQRSANVPARRFFLYVALLALVAVVIGLAVSPSCADAKSYTMPSVDIDAQLETDGSLHVVEQRTFEFEGSYSAVWWTFGLLPTNAEVSVSSVRIVSLDEDGEAAPGQTKLLESVPFDLEWREEGGPGKDSYSMDSPYNTVYVFFGSEPGSIVVELDYTITNMAQVYDDVTEVYWQYLGSQWGSDSCDVTATLQLPLPQGATVQPAENVYAWGHGPLDGTVSIRDDASVVCEVAKVKSGEYAEMRVLIPSTWLTNLSLKSLRLHAGEQRLDTVLSEEKIWADKANTQRMMSLAFMIACAAVCVLAVVIALVLYFRYGKEYTPDFKDKYLKELPEEGIHPAVVGRLWRWNRENVSDLAATIMHLCQLGAVKVEAGTYATAGADGAAESTGDYCIKRLVSTGSLTDPIDRAAMRLLFDRVAGGQDSFWFGSIETYAKTHSKEMVTAVGDWQDAISVEVTRRGFFEEKGQRYQKVLWVTAGILFVASLAIWLNMDNALVFAFSIPTCLALAFIGNYMPRRSREGNNLVARCKALRNWLRDFGSLEQDSQQLGELRWDELMVLAYVFGVSESAMDQVRRVAPQVLGAPGATRYSGIPWWAWYLEDSVCSDKGKGGLLHPSAFLTKSIDAAYTTAYEAEQAASGGSSGSGSGGGFSSGGGGGFGGGGGGAR